MQLPTKKPKIFVSVLNLGWIRPEISNLIGQMKADPRADVVVAYCTARPSENNRNQTVIETLSGGYDFLFTIDHDTIPTRNPIDLAFMDLDVVGFAYPQWNMLDPAYPIYFIGMDRVEGGYNEHKNREGLQEVDAVGSGALLMSRKVLEAVKEPFMRKWENGFAVTGLDFYFCEKAKEAGFKVHCHYDYVADHIKEISLLDVLAFKHHG